MTNEQRAAIEKLIGRGLTAEEIGRGSITRPQDSTLREKIAAANQGPAHQPRWMEDTLENAGAQATKETRKQAFARLRASQNQRVEDAEGASEQAAKLANDPVFNRMNRISEQALERMRWDASYPESAWQRVLQMREAAKANERDTFQALNNQHVEFLESVTGERQAAIDGEIARLNDAKKSLAEDRYNEPLATPTPDTYSHIRRASGMMQFISRVDGEIFEYDERIPHAKELALERLAAHHQNTAVGEPITQ
jgi:hypothetical protein